jgi:peptidoglycan/LPS O-acetylase OafA/YrhL
LRAITSVRFFFAAMVFVGHFVGHYYPVTITNVPGYVFTLPPIAVSWFFVLSGFIIAYNYPTLPSSIDRNGFLIARVARLWPVHIITTIAMILLQGGGKYYPFFLTMTHAWTASPNMTMAYNGPSWSISDEMFFYVAYVGLVAPARWIRVLVVAAPIALAVALSTSHGCFLPGEGSGEPPLSTPQCVTLVWTFPPARLIEFLAGVALCHFRPRVPQIVGLTAALAVAGGFVPGVPGISLFFAHVVWQLEVIIGGGLLIASLANDGWLARLLSFRWLVIGGEISYSVYMTHQIVNFVVLPRADGLGLAVTFALVSAITIIASLCLFYFVEAPVRDAVKLRLKRWRSSRFHSAEGRAVSAGAGSAVASSASFEK